MGQSVSRGEDKHSWTGKEARESSKGTFTSRILAHSRVGNTKRRLRKKRRKGDVRDIKSTASRWSALSSAMVKRKASTSSVSASSNTSATPPASPIEVDERARRVQRRRLTSEDSTGQGCSTNSFAGPAAESKEFSHGPHSDICSSRKGKAVQVHDESKESSRAEEKVGAESAMQVDDTVGTDSIAAAEVAVSSENDASTSLQVTKDKGKGKDNGPMSSAEPPSELVPMDTESATGIADTERSDQVRPGTPSTTLPQPATIMSPHRANAPISSGDRHRPTHPAIASALSRAAMRHTSQSALNAATQRRNRSGSEPLSANVNREIRHEHHRHDGPPSILSALLADILGLNGRPPPSASGAATREESAAASRLIDRSARPSAPPVESTPTSTPDIGVPNALPQSRPRNLNMGGTSVIVQGALITRAAQSSQSQEAQRTSTEQSGIERSTNESSSSQEQSSASSTESVANGSHTGGDGAATIEEQADMLSRLLSVATAATASSLVSHALLARPMTQSQSHASPAAFSPQLVERNPSTLYRIPSRPSAMSSRSESGSDSGSGSRWGRRISSIMGRMYGLGERFLGTRRADNRSAETPAPSPSQRSEQSGVVASSNSEGGDMDASRSINSVSYMLREAIREGLEGPRLRRVTAAPENSTNRQSNDSSTNAEAPLPNASSVDAAPAVGPSVVDSSTVNPDATERIRRVDAILDAVRQGSQERGEPGSFDRFIFELADDLNAAVRGLPSSAQPLNVPISEDLQRRRQDIQDGQLSFYRSFTFPAAPPRTASTRTEQPDTAGESETSPSHGSTPSQETQPEPPLFPCIVVGVRSMEAPESASAAPQPPSSSGNSDSATSASLSSPAPVTSGEPSQFATTRQTPHDVRQDQASAPRFLLFVSGGHYPSSHPVFHASSEEAGRDLMILMEFLGAMASFQHKPATVSPEQIKQSNLRTIKGDPSQIADLLKQGQVTENTSEKCLICLEDWSQTTMALPASNETTNKDVEMQEVEEERRLLGCKHLFHASCIGE